ncbi:uncharacterized protein SPPG_00569 [Spizellomyces punctatus DAOM BR117]|uniref:Cap-specific mRNA (nucleoside-2'-O-)-methyltransferase 1 n=1 Tax=Spizellomyces punctatus (strain DAOM BR117) TaxID=645134 RepID=A0A0L0HU39_SPIPD|nr:uncharacterized protein SPPG_00569 [Spizellomyces punctatus DAOM BR117]KND04871.1 hypothetical protein SPPG_00569 [Spizellomyces punctatus DAOM BR117]|eukprot:XP_016612910.1 hypothetical protein SPPG_00569 [Spizellomyces punctatus DAOM BR117]
MATTGNDLYTDDPEYIATPLVSPVPPPQLTPPRLRNRHDNGRAPVDRAFPPSPAVYRTDKTVAHEQSVQWMVCDASLEDDEWLQHLRILVEEVGETDYSRFCEKTIVENLVAAKEKLKDLAPQDMYRAKSRANPYQCLGKSIFAYPTAVKMANMDALFQFTDINARTGTGELRFADLCSGPGGFTEYLLWRANARGIPIRGWGMTSRGRQDSALDRMHPDSCVKQLFEPFYGDGTGDLRKNENIRGFHELVEYATNNEGLDLVMADSGEIDIAGNQEYHIRQLVLCQVLAALLVLRKHGDFVMQIFDVFTPFTVDILYILYRCFEKVTIVKPLASPPDTAERYIVCRNLRVPHPPRIIEHLFAVNDRMNDLRAHQAKDALEVTGLMDRDAVNGDEKFIDRVRSVNMRLCIRQTEALQELRKYADDPSLSSFDQIEVRNRCLREWKLPIPDPPPPERQWQERHSHQDRRSTERFSPYGRRDGDRRNFGRSSYNGRSGRGMDGRYPHEDRATYRDGGHHRDHR